MRRITNFCLLFIALFFFSCEKQEIKELSNSKPNIYVENGILCFKDQKSVETLKKELSGKEFDELAAWEDSIGFKSLERSSSDIMDAIFCRAEQLVANGLSQQEVIKKFDSGEIQEVPDELQQKMDELKLVYKKDEDGLRSIDYSFTIPFSNRFVNENYEVVIADTLYKYFKDKIEIYPSFSKTNLGIKVEPMIATYSIIKSDPSLKDVILTTRSASLCYDAQADGDHKLTANFAIVRIIYQQSGCASNCVKSQAFAYIYYQGYYHNWLGYHAGTYLVDGNVAFDVWYNNGTTNYLPRQEFYFYHAGSSPITVYSSPVWNNPDYPWIAIGNVDCGMVDMYFDLPACVFNQYFGTDGSQPKFGYSDMVYLSN